MADDARDSSPPDRDAERRTVAVDADRAAGATPGQFQPGEDLKIRQDRLLDEALQDSFAGSDPMSPRTSPEVSQAAVGPPSGPAALVSPARPPTLPG